MYRPVPARIDLPAMEQEVLGFWDANDVFHRSLAATRDGEPWVFYEGPPTANGMPGTHHIEARVFKDVFPRFKTMQGRFVPRKAGWDCHGLPVELAVERELGPQVWSINQPAFAERLADLQRKITSGTPPPEPVR